jgi:photosystem II stability/assembly factor-like uncharacterized protein
VALAGQAQTWNQIGPNPINASGRLSTPNATVSGLINDIAIDPRGSTDSTIYVTTGGGGIWKTTNGGAKWERDNGHTTRSDDGSRYAGPFQSPIVSTQGWAVLGAARVARRTSR